MAEWEDLRRECEACRGCSLWETRTNLVFGAGSETAELMFVGEAPGEKEDLSGIPFVGRAGELLDKYLYAVDIPREKVYIANILKCRPPKNRDPLPAEEDACIRFLWRQIELIDPKVIVCLGRISAHRLIGDDFRITRDHGQWYVRRGRAVTAVFHPAALLRDPRRKGDMLDDMKMIKQKLGELTSPGEEEKR